MSGTVPAQSSEGISPSVNVPADAGRRVWEVATNVILALMFLRFAVQCGEAAWTTMRLSTWLLLAKVSTDVVFFLTRRLPKGVSMSLYDWCIGIIGTFAIVLFRTEHAGRDLLVGQVLQVSGILLQVLAMFSLNRSIGVVAANRGVKTGGLYRYVRHPLYLSYIIAFLGYVVNHPTAWNIGIYAAAVDLWVLRLLAEERFLFRDPQYRDYAAQVRWRLLPGVF